MGAGPAANVVGYIGVQREANTMNIFQQYVAGGSVATLLIKWPLEIPMMISLGDTDMRYRYYGDTDPRGIEKTQGFFNGCFLFVNSFSRC